MDEVTDKISKIKRNCKTCRYWDLVGLGTMGCIPGPGRCDWNVFQLWEPRQEDNIKDETDNSTADDSGGVNKHESVRGYNIGSSDYSDHKIQPWDIWLEYDLNPWDADIIKRVLRTKKGERILDYKKIKHICDERIRQCYTYDD